MPHHSDRYSQSDETFLETSLTLTQRREREKKRRRTELFIAGCAFLVVLFFTSIQLNQLHTGDKFFVFLFHVNFILLLGILLIVLRNVIKLVFERKRHVLGSKLRSKMVLAFGGISLLPCLLMFLVTTKYVQLSIDFWFKEQIETSMEAALDVAQGFFENTGERLTGIAKKIKEDIKEKNIELSSDSFHHLLKKTKKEENISLLGVILRNGNPIFWQSDGSRNLVWPSAFESFDWKALDAHNSSYILVPGFDTDSVFCAVPLSSGYFIILARNMGAGFKAKMDRIIKGSGEYRALRQIKKPLKSMLYSSLGILTALIMLGATWFGFRMARQISAPVLAVAAGTERITKGDLSVRLPDSSEDELGMLIRSFNQMAQDLEKSRLEIIGINNKLESQNIKIEQHNKYIETVLNNIAAGVISFDAEGYVMTTNKAASDILSTKPEDLLGKSIDAILPKSHNIFRNKALLKSYQRVENRIQQTISLTIDNEERRLLVNVVGFLFDGVYSGSVAVFEDISELERMQRMDAWREVARRIAHEIKNPLTPIKLSAQRIAKKFGNQVEDPVFIESTQLIVKQVEHLQSMVQEFSAFAKLPEVKPKLDCLEPLLQNLSSLFRNSHPNIRWELEIDPELPNFLMDKEALNRAFMNLLTNAAEALMHQQGNSDPCVRIVVKYLSLLHLVRIDTIDNGPGLTEEERSRIFDPYFSRKKGGTGLGLPIVRSIVSDHRGYVRALPNENDNSGGTVISMELPVT